MRCRCCPSLLILLAMLIVVSLELVVSIVDNLVVAVILPSVVYTFSIVYQNHLRTHGWWWSMNGGLGRPSALGIRVQIPDSPAQVFHWWVFPRGKYCKEDEYIVGAGYLQVTIYMSWVCIFNCLTWWLVDWQHGLWISQLYQTGCQYSRIQWVVSVLHPLCCRILFFP